MGFLYRPVLVGVICALFLPCASSQTYRQLAELTGSMPGALVSFSVAVNGNTLVVGAPNAGAGGYGLAYVYTAGSAGWTNPVLTATLIQSGEKGSDFGYAVAISGNTIVVSGYDPVNLSEAAYIYVSPSGTAEENAELFVSGPAGGSSFSSVAIDGGIIVAGLASAGSGRGAAYVYVEPQGGWTDMTQTAVLVGSGSSANAGFGSSVAISGRTIVVGAPRSGTGALQAGRAYVFVEPAAGWAGTREQTGELEASNGISGAYFGTWVSINGETVAVGAPDQSVGSNQGQGAVYIYTKPSTGWPRNMTETAEVSARGGKSDSQIGNSVAISGAELVAGAPGALNQQGIVYVFSEPIGGWKSGLGGVAISASDGAPDNAFGIAVGLGDGVLAVSAADWPDGYDDAEGAVYLFGVSR